MELPKIATDPVSDTHRGALALVILTGQRDSEREWALVNDRLTDLARALELGDAQTAESCLLAARDALVGVGRATTRALADADAVRAALDGVQALLGSTTGQRGVQA
jgi:hypothetical protein